MEWAPAWALFSVNVAEILLSFTEGREWLQRKPKVWSYDDFAIDHECINVHLNISRWHLWDNCSLSELESRDDILNLIGNQKLVPALRSLLIQREPNRVILLGMNQVPRSIQPDIRTGLQHLQMWRRIVSKILQQLKVDTYSVRHSKIPSPPIWSTSDYLFLSTSGCAGIRQLSDQDAQHHSVPIAVQR